MPAFLLKQQPCNIRYTHLHKDAEWVEYTLIPLKKIDKSTEDLLEQSIGKDAQQSFE